jgi:septal ring factor EnvC (AmiA/AmiB activator)
MRRVLATGAVLAALLLAAAGHADRREDLEALRRAIEESRERVAAYERQQRGLLETIEALDRAAALLARDVDEARRSAAAAARALAEIEAEARVLAARLAVTRRAMRARSVALYQAGELGAVRLLFSSDGLPAFLSRVSALRRLLTHDAELLERHREQSAALAAAELRARESALRLAEAEVRLSERSAELAAERARKGRLVARLYDDRARERAALAELERAARALEETLASLGAEASRSDRSLEGPPFQSLRRRLEPPVDAPISRGFGRVVDAEFLTATFQSGVVFEAALGSPVHAIASGRVRFAGWFRGFGRLAILDHGEGYFSVSGHLDSLEVSVGAPVRARQVIGRVGETGSLAGPRLYFEIRRGGEALDPADWLRSAGPG